ncbi:MAG: hypothetical protein Q9207_007206, partial [Kuettlingeria erythrocarpa]
MNGTLLTSLIKTVQYTSNGSMVPYVRVPAQSPDLVNYALTAGAGGVVMPHVQNAEQAKAFVQLARFPPLGDRSYPPNALFGKQTTTPEGKTIYDIWNEHAAIVCQIEDVEGVENVERIATVAGGASSPIPSDLPFSSPSAETKRRGSMDGDEPEFLAALTKIQRAADANGLAVLGFARTQLIPKPAQAAAEGIELDHVEVVPREGIGKTEYLSKFPLSRGKIPGLDGPDGLKLTETLAITT